MEFDTVLKKRASVRKYSSKKVAPEDITDCVIASNLAPNPGNLQLLTYIIVNEKKLIEKLAVAAQQEFISEAPYIVVVCSNNKHISKLYEERADKYLKQHAGAAIENFLLKVTDLGLTSCWIGAFSDITVRDILHIPDDFEIEALLPVAYETTLVKTKTKQRLKHDLRMRVFFNSWKNRFFTRPEEIRSFSNY